MADPPAPAADHRANRLVDESSPYLQQHAYNPVRWFPWGEEAAARARAEDKPIFLSIGYAACHWCHVMERESFADEAIAELLDRHFIAVKVDREERPDVDAVYMTAVQAISGSGGWPLSAFLTPDGKPFFGGTYFPPERRHGMPSFREVLEAVAQAWTARRGEIERSAADLAARLGSWPQAQEPGAVDVDSAVQEAMARLARAFDLRRGGFGGAPKFPTPSRLFFLLRRVEQGDGLAERMLASTLEAMAAGGMYDWVGGGFHRYSVDADWLIPHFEKMLYDNALLARAYGEAGVRLERADFLAVARETAHYLRREMQGPEGGLYASTDADSEGEEGRYFTWTADELHAALPAADAELVVRLCALGGPPSFEHGRSVLRPRVPLTELARELGVDEAEAARRVAGARAGLLAARTRRVQPALDDKRLAGWNGMAIWALAWLGATLEEPELLAAARRAARHQLTAMVGRDGRIARSWRDGRVSGAETAEDVAWVIAGLVELFESDGDEDWLAAALRITGGRIPHYLDRDGACWDAPDDGEPLIVRPRSATDGATPAAAGVLASALLRLAAITGRDELARVAERLVAAEKTVIEQFPDAACTLLEAAVQVRRPPSSVVIVGEPAWESTRALLRAARRNRPATTVVVPAAPPVRSETVGLVPPLAGRERCPDGRALAYLCEGASCRLPTSSPEAVAAALREGASPR